MSQETFRAANRRMSAAATVSNSTLIPFLCECADFECLGTVEATLGEFEVIHDSEYRYFVLPGHILPDGELILSENDRYQVFSQA